MKIQILSDLHLDASRMDLNNNGADLVILAGDISFELYNFDWLLNKLYPAKIIFVPGNHDFDNRKFENLEQDINEIFSTYEPGAYYLNNKSVIIDDIKFIGSTLWTDFSFNTNDLNEKEKSDIAQMLSSHVKHINYNGKPMNYKDVMSEHKKSIDFLNFELKQNRQSDIVDKTFVITHFAPHKNSVSPNYSKSHNCYHVTDLEHLMGFSDYWIHGHMHESHNYIINDTEVICNPRGYNLIFNLNQNHKFKLDYLLSVNEIEKNNKLNKKI